MTDYVVFHEHQAALKENRPAQYDSPAAKDDLFGFILAGHDNSSTTIQWGLKLLADHPAVQDDLRATLRRTFPDGPSSGAAIAKATIPYLDATIDTAYLQLRIVLVVLMWHFEFPKLAESLSSYAAKDTASTRVPCQCYVSPVISAPK
ncbi:hypothetical protein ANO11243_091150 [Dothideomycetidae sp. 11243]|nr:hypothetical protein ANO11243_091150 [fungal sp. No.11243]